MRLRAMAVRVGALALAAAAVAWVAPRFGATYVAGGSMEPRLVPGDLVVFRRGGQAAKEGDIVLVSRPGWPTGVLHRVIDVSPDGSLELRGDANTVADREPALPSAVRGVAVLVVPMGRGIAALQRLVRGWYNRPSQNAYLGYDGEARGAGTTARSREGPDRLKGPRAANALAVHSISRAPDATVSAA